jgi:hypothetical protein
LGKFGTVVDMTEAEVTWVRLPIRVIIRVA